jgi:hypothetical protein
MTLHTATSHRLQIPVPRYKSLFNRQITSEYFQRKLKLLQSKVHGHKQKKLRHMYGVAHIKLQLV